MEVSDSITNWYKNQTVFLTGGSGFIGKALIFKLLTCGTDRIYLLIRTKKGQNPEERLNMVAEHWIYDKLRAQGIDVRSKLFPVAGDVTLPQLGISEKDRLLLQEEVTVVFHVAASIKFDDPLKMAVFFNLRSARDVVDLAKGMKKLKMCHHVSTAYCNIDQMHSKPIMEKVYTRKMDWKALIEFVETSPDELVTAIEMKIIDKHVNSYLFTKHLAESVFEDAAHYIPVTISRPPIVMCSEKDPEPGWIDGTTSALMMMAAVGKGVLRVTLGHGDNPKAYTSVDSVVNMILVSSWNTAHVKKGIVDGQLEVFNGEYYPLSSRELVAIGRKLFEKMPMHNALWRLKHHDTRSVNLYLIYNFFVHILPALFFDTMLSFSGKRPQLIRLYRKIYVAMFNVFPIVEMVDKFDNINYTNLKKTIPENERDTFTLDIPNTEEKVFQYMISGVKGIRKFFGDPPHPSPKEFQYQRRLYWLDIALQGALILFVLWLLPLHLLAVPFS